MSDKPAASFTLPGDRQVQVTMHLAVPRERVFNAYTTPELLRKWWGGGRGELTTCEVDLRPGGQWHYVMTMPDGTDVGFHGEYKDVVPNERVVYSDVLENQGGIETLNTVTFAEDDGISTVTILVQHATQENRDAQAKGMNVAAIQKSNDKLEEIAGSA